jgi:hypothetical protein
MKINDLKTIAKNHEEAKAKFLNLFNAEVQAWKEAMADGDDVKAESHFFMATTHRHTLETVFGVKI